MGVVKGQVEICEFVSEKAQVKSGVVGNQGVGFDEVMEVGEDLGCGRLAGEHFIADTVHPAGGPVNFLVGVDEVVKLVGQSAVFNGDCADFDNPVAIFWRKTGSFKIKDNMALRKICRFQIVCPGIKAKREELDRGSRYPLIGSLSIKKPYDKSDYTGESLYSTLAIGLWAGFSSVGKSTGEEIKDISQHTGISFIDLCKLASGAGYGGEFFVLDIKNLRESTAGSRKLTGFKFVVIALGALPVVMLHN